MTDYSDDIDVVIHHSGVESTSTLYVYTLFKDVKYFPIYNIQKLPEFLIKDLTGKNVLFVDYSLPKYLMSQLQKVCRRIYITSKI